MTVLILEGIARAAHFETILKLWLGHKWIIGWADTLADADALHYKQWIRFYRQCVG